MNHSEKAKELIEKYLNQEINFAYIDTKDAQCIGAGYMTYNSAKQCAIVHVEGIIEALNAFGYAGAMFDDFETGYTVWTTDKDPTEYWQQVKKELTK